MKRFLLAVAVLLPLFAALPAQAFESFTRAAFEMAQDRGDKILLHVHAPWCPTCRAQEPGVAMIEKSRPEVTVFRVDFDSQKDVLRQLRVNSQSTLIAFAGKVETGRVVGVTDGAAIAALVK
ncbi:MAG: thioredoxin family protein [Magnetospirillum gryphiswaldense]|nr:thioredoxin family protein [Magnetospirillum gryphiswaldense]